MSYNSHISQRYKFFQISSITKLEEDDRNVAKHTNLLKCVRSLGSDLAQPVGLMVSGSSNRDDLPNLK